MLLGAFLIPSLAHASTGIVSVNGGNLVSGTLSPSSVNVPINIQNSNALNGFDIQVFADPAILRGSSVSLSGSVLTNSPTIVLECIDGVLVTGTVCSGNDVAGVVHLAAVQNSLTSSPTTGLLFTISYNVVSDTTGTTISFQTGCTGTSTGNSDCVTIANGSGTAVPETDQAATFANLIDFRMTAQYPALSTPSGVPISDVITFTSLGGYQDVIDVSVTSGCTMSSPTVDLTVATSGTDTMTCSGTSSFSPIVTGTGEGLFGPVKTHSLTIPVQIAAPDFSVSLSQSSVTISRGNSDSTTMINLNGFGGFSGTVAFTASSVSGITGSAPSATLTNNGSGLSTATSTLTISVSSAVATGSYMLTLTGTSGAHSHSAMITVNVPGQDFSIVAVPNSISIVRGGTLAADLDLASIGNFAGTITFSASIVPVSGQQDSCCRTDNITPGYSPATGTLTAGGTATVAFFGSTVSGVASTGPDYTATGNYTATITATSGSLIHTAVITFNVQDFSIGPSFCTGDNFVQTSPDSLSSTVIDQDPNGVDFAGQFIGTPCSSLTITDQPNPLLPYLSIFSSQAQILWVQASALGGFVTNGFDGGPSVSALNPALPFRGVKVPQLAPVFGPDEPNNVCMVPTFWPNGTQIPYSYLAANGPIIAPSSGLYPFLGIIDPDDFAGVANWGCRFDNAAYPRDVGNSPELNQFMNGVGPGTGNFGICPPNFDASTPCNYQNVLNPDYWGVTAMSLVGTIAGAYTFKLCANNGSTSHCETYTLNIIHAPVVNQLSYTHKLSIAKTGGVQNIKVGINNPDSHTIYAQVTVTAIGSLGDTFTVTSPVVTIAPLSTATNIPLSFTVTPSMIGETFTFSTSVAVGLDPTNLDGSSTEASGAILHGSFTVLK